MCQNSYVYVTGENDRFKQSQIFGSGPWRSGSELTLCPALPLSEHLAAKARQEPNRALRQCVYNDRIDQMRFGQRRHMPASLDPSETPFRSVLLRQVDNLANGPDRVSC